MFYSMSHTRFINKILNLANVCLPNSNSCHISGPLNQYTSRGKKTLPIGTFLKKDAPPQKIIQDRFRQMLLFPAMPFCLGCACSFFSAETGYSRVWYTAPYWFVKIEKYMVWETPSLLSLFSGCRAPVSGSPWERTVTKTNH